MESNVRMDHHTWSHPVPPQLVQHKSNKLWAVKAADLILLALEKEKLQGKWRAQLLSDVFCLNAAGGVGAGERLDGRAVRDVLPVTARVILYMVCHGVK